MLLPPDFHAVRLLARAVHWLLVCLACGLVTACMSVHITAGEGEVRMSRHFGVLSIELAEPKAAIAGEVLGVGVIGSPLGWSIGYTTQRWALLGEGCRAVIWTSGGDLDPLVVQEARHAAGVCLPGHGSEKNPAHQ
ncbi:hypothetical protein [Pseudorhodoferax sp.]|uniref:hypothetical protein n=1 Tax=Pseudorhodoferax sp. TaxID=1993553 RepID=UPI002DD68A2A|nr:hypothetical protein [Pseudorhodoferax sp.]